MSEVASFLEGHVMKFATFEHGGREQVGWIEADRVYPIDVGDMLDLIARYDEVAAAISERRRGIALGDVRLLAPIPRPRRNIFCVGKNYRDHAHEFARSGYEAGAIKGAEIDDYPAMFTKPGSCVVGPGETVQTHPSVTSSVDYEGELAVVIGRQGRDIDRTQAMGYVWGYTIVNDVTARDRQKKHRQWFLGKALDGFCPMGPWITTADEVQANDLTLQTRVNGELRQNANTRDLIFGIPSLIETLSAGLTLQPGDVIATGTPAGVGLGFDPPRFLGPGDEVTVTITGLGTLCNPFA
jgi:2-keto-4-pentenoate hydratase/2-oxohepta-3-ene-1,7-dioic acid hydratase in catechol pathway